MNYYKVQAQSLLQRINVTMRNPLTASNYGLLHNTLAALLARFELADGDVEVVGFPGDEPSNLPGATYSSQTLASSTYSAFTGTQVVDVPTIAQALDYARAEGASEATHEHVADCSRAYDNGARDTLGALLLQFEDSIATFQNHPGAAAAWTDAARMVRELLK